MSAAGDPPPSTSALPKALFRPEAVAHQALSQSGTVVMGPEKFAPLVGVSLSVAMIAFGLCAFCLKLPKIFVVPGTLQVSGSEIRISTSKPARVLEIAVKEGSFIKKGQVLGVFSVEQADDTTSTQADNLSTAERLLAVRRAALPRIRNQQNEDLGRLEAKRQGLIVQRLELEAQLAIKREIKATHDDALARAEAVHSRGFVSENEYVARRMQSLQAEAEVKQTEASLKSLSVELGQLRFDETQATLSAGEREGAATDSILNAERALVAAKAAKSYRVYAPATGRVTAIFVGAGSQAAAAKTVMTILPIREATLAKLYIPPASIEHVKIGTSVKLRFDAFPYQIYGTVAGYVSAVGGSVVTTADDDDAPKDRKTYRVLVKLPDGIVTSGGHRIPLRSGATLSAALTAERASLARWLFADRL